MLSLRLYTSKRAWSLKKVCSYNYRTHCYYTRGRGSFELVPADTSSAVFRLTFIAEFTDNRHELPNFVTAGITDTEPLVLAALHDLNVRRPTGDVRVCSMYVLLLFLNLILTNLNPTTLVFSK